MSINITFFNVGHGDSILIEKSDSDRTKTIIIDCNLDFNNKSKVPVYEYLKEKKVQIIDALIITHMHKDHISGLHSIINDNTMNIKKLIIPPIFSLRAGCYDEIFKCWEDSIKRDAQYNHTDKEIVADLHSRATILKFILENKNIVEELHGKESVLRFEGIEDVEFCVYLPLTRVKPTIENILKKKNFSPNMFPKLNDSSLAIKLTYGRNSILLTGDSTSQQWNEHKRLMKSCGVHSLNSNMLKAPHHGAIEDNTEDLYHYYLDNSEKEKYVFISAAGNNKKPHERVLKFISNSKDKIRIRCTNISKSCLGEYSSFDVLDELPVHIRSFMSNYDIESTPKPCFGNIYVTLDKDSSPVVKSNTNNSCIYDIKL